MTFLQVTVTVPQSPVVPAPAPSAITSQAGTAAIEANIARLEAMVERMSAGADRTLAAAERLEGPPREQLQLASEQLRQQAEIARAQLAEASAQLEAAREGGATEFTYTTAPQFPFEADMPPGVVTVSIAFFVMIAVIAVGIPIARAFGRRMDRRSAGPAGASPDVVDRLQRIEHAVDAIAIEVERVSEGQRYTTKVVSELRALPSPDVVEHAAMDRLGARGSEAAVGAKPDTR